MKKIRALIAGIFTWLASRVAPPAQKDLPKVETVLSEPIITDPIAHIAETMKEEIHAEEDGDSLGGEKYPGIEHFGEVDLKTGTVKTWKYASTAPSQPPARIKSAPADWAMRGKPGEIEYENGDKIAVNYPEKIAKRNCAYCEDSPRPNPNCKVCLGSGQVPPPEVSSTIPNNRIALDTIIEAGQKAFDEIKRNESSSV